MGLCFYCINTHRHLHLLLSFLLLMSSTQVRFSAEGRSLFKLLDIAKEGEAQKVVMVRSLIGSRPPRCDKRCISCGHCEAVQVPAVPQDRINGAKFFPTTFYSRGDYSSNYKPMSWKCKCGDMILNP